MPIDKEQGTGKRGHTVKDNKASSSSTHAAQGKSGSSSEEASLKAREYRDENGEIHHHTKSYMDQRHK